MKKMIFAILTLAVFGVMGSTVLTSGPAYADGVCPAGAPNPGAKTPAECFLDPPAGTEKNAMNTVKNLIDTAIGVVGVAAVIVMIIGGVYFVISQGDAAKITRACNTIIYGLVGLIIAVLAFAIVNFVLQGMFNGSSTQQQQQQQQQQEDAEKKDSEKEDSKK